MSKFAILLALVAATTVLASGSPLAQAKYSLFTRRMAAGGSEPEARANEPQPVLSGCLTLRGKLQSFASIFCFIPDLRRKFELEEEEGLDRRQPMDSRD